MSEPIHGFKVKKLLSVTMHPDLPNQIALVLEDTEGKRQAMLLDSSACQEVAGAILTAMPQADGEPFGIDLSKDLQAIERIDDVALSRGRKESATPFDLDFQFEGQSRVKLHLSPDAAVRMMHRLQTGIRDYIRGTHN